MACLTTCLASRYRVQAYRRSRVAYLASPIEGTAAIQTAAEYTIRSVIELSTRFGVRPDLIAISVMVLFYVLFVGKLFEPF